MTTCPNCSEFILGHPKNGCILAALIDVVRDRQNKSESKLFVLHRDINEDALWNSLGPIIDALENGEYTR